MSKRKRTLIICLTAVDDDEESKQTRNYSSPKVNQNCLCLNFEAIEIVGTKSPYKIDVASNDAHLQNELTESLSHFAKLFFVEITPIL